MATIARYHPTDWSRMPDLDLYMDQVITFLKRQLEPFQSSNSAALITPSIINNYVKGGVVPRPVNKKYAKSQLGALLMACILKRALPIEGVKRLINADGEVNQARYERFFDELGSVISEEADALTERLQRETNDNPEALAMHYVLCASVSCLIADRLLDLTKPPPPQPKKK